MFPGFLVAEGPDPLRSILGMGVCLSADEAFSQEQGIFGSVPGSSLDYAGAATPLVRLNIYDACTSKSGFVLNRILRPMGSGAFHCGVEIFGREWSYRGCQEGTGVFCCTPRYYRGQVSSESMEMGISELSSCNVLNLIGVLQQEWLGQDYQLLSHNCCHFCQRLCACLGVNPIPPWVMSLAETVVRAVHTIEGVSSECGCSKEPLCCRNTGTGCSKRCCHTKVHTVTLDLDADRPEDSKRLNPNELDDMETIRALVRGSENI